MKYYVYRPQMTAYLRADPTGNQWVEDTANATRFADETKVRNFLTKNFLHKKDHCPYDELSLFGVQQGELIPVPLSDILTPTVQAASSPPKAKVVSQPKPSQPKTKAKPHTPQEPSQEDVEATLQQLVDCLDRLRQVEHTLPQLTQHLAKQHQLSDLEQEDLLHKIELTNASVVDGYRLYKQLQEVRLRRRQAKDSLHLLDLLRQCGFDRFLHQFLPAYEKYSQNLQNRTYRPRVRQELFDGKHGHPKRVMLQSLDTPSPSAPHTTSSDALTLPMPATDLPLQ